MSAALSAEPLVHAGAAVTGGRLGRFTEVGEGARLLNVTLDDYSYCDRFADIANAAIGKFANIAAFARINPGDHPMERATQHHFTYRASRYWPGAAGDDPVVFDRRAAAACALGHDCWIGHGAVVLAGRRVGVGAVVGAGAVVTRDVPDYAVAVGNPARVVRRRFPEAVAERLLRLAWWDWDHGRLRAALDDFRSLPVEAFLARHESGAGGDP